MTRYRTKPGAHGTLYLYRRTYRADPGAPLFTFGCWAYDEDDAEERWAWDGDTDWYDVSPWWRAREESSTP